MFRILDHLLYVPKMIIETVHEILILMTYEVRKGSDKSGHLCNFIRAFAAHINKVGTKMKTPVKI